jgi:hypothetical protein
LNPVCAIVGSMLSQEAIKVWLHLLIWTWSKLAIIQAQTYTKILF